MLLEVVDKPHNLPAVLRTFNDAAKGSQKWVALQAHNRGAAGVRAVNDRDLLKCLATTDHCITTLALNSG
ncbi:hypothetical protein [Synechococcus sp. L2F]|uniref:hypothetical protein n=1 Tax=Synechococcus sp. L2F TaxID=2823739 RepID=UPI0020CD7456|nr:hypothetical protein [Synechococcus sp. L2F]